MFVNNRLVRKVELVYILIVLSLCICLNRFSCSLAALYVYVYGRYFA